MEFKTKPIKIPNSKSARAQIEALLFSRTLSSNFTRWFSNSAVKDADGNPRVVFRGTRKEPLPDNEFKLTSDRATPSFSNDPALASVYARKNTQPFGPKEYGAGSTVTPAYLSIQKPLDISSFGQKISLYNLMDAIGLDAEDIDSLVVRGLYASLYETAENVGAEFDDFMGRPSAFFSQFRERDSILKLKTLQAIEFDAHLVADNVDIVGRLIKLGFDGVIHSEVVDGALPYYQGSKKQLLNALTYRPFFQTQIKSAIGNNGNFDPNDPRIDR